MDRRNFLTGLLFTPAVITTPGLLMPVRAIEPVSYLIPTPNPGPIILIQNYAYKELALVTGINDVSLGLYQ
jgi:hypothetical protein